MPVRKIKAEPVEVISLAFFMYIIGKLVIGAKKEKERLDRLLAVIPAEYKIAEPLKKIPKSMMVVIEKVK